MVSVKNFELDLFIKQIIWDVTLFSSISEADKMETAKENIESYYIEELHSIKEEIVTLKKEFSRFLQRANQQHIEEILEEMRTSFMKTMVNYLRDDASERMHRQMVQDCKMRDFCEKKFN